MRREDREKVNMERGDQARRRGKERGWGGKEESKCGRQGEDTTAGNERGVKKNGKYMRPGEETRTGGRVEATSGDK